MVSETITPTQPCLVHGIKYPKTEKMAEFACAAGEKKISISSKTYLLFVLGTISYIRQTAGYNYNRQICAEKERGRDGFSLGDNQVDRGKGNRYL